ncbi:MULTISPECIES: toxin-antitoxin system YwqK family antitoxin [unclassified Acinetobacter]|uniref:toxin-antitoxin system YwqK family antitoxin n=1 Tax=unclassified Acinetobacter TaxID=196816 RepID=UPI0035BA5FE7
MLKITRKTLVLTLALGLSSLAMAAPAEVAVNQKIAGSEVYKNQAIVAYFDEAGELEQQPSETGYYRLLLGRNSQGHYLIQDFFVKSQQKQMEPIWSFSAEGLLEFGSDHVHGELKNYYNNGQVKSTQRYNRGKAVGEGQQFYPTGELMMRITNKGSTEQHRYYYRNGKPAAEVNYKNNEVTSYKAWDEQGQKTDDIDTIVNDIEKSMQGYS